MVNDMAWIQTILENQATDLLKQIYEDLTKKRGKLANIMKVHSLNPQAMKNHMDLYLTLMFKQSPLNREERELIAVVVSTLNQCSYCVKHHAAALNHYWKNQEKIGKVIQNYESVDLSEKTIHMLQYVEKLTKTPQLITEEDIKSLKRSGLSDEHILNINLITSYFNFVNRIALGLGVTFTKYEVKGYN